MTSYTVNEPHLLLQTHIKEGKKPPQKTRTLRIRVLNRKNSIHASPSPTPSRPPDKKKKKKKKKKKTPMDPTVLPTTPSNLHSLEVSLSSPRPGDDHYCEEEFDQSRETARARGTYIHCNAGIRPVISSPPRLPSEWGSNAPGPSRHS
jgi:hypothetical protein